jgi:hypothetical protein
MVDEHGVTITENLIPAGSAKEITVSDIMDAIKV